MFFSDRHYTMPKCLTLFCVDTQQTWMNYYICVHVDCTHCVVDVALLVSKFGQKVKCEGDVWIECFLARMNNWQTNEFFGKNSKWFYPEPSWEYQDSYQNCHNFIYDVAVRVKIVFARVRIQSFNMRECIAIYHDTLSRSLNTNSHHFIHPFRDVTFAKQYFISLFAFFFFFFKVPKRILHMFALH